MFKPRARQKATLISTTKSSSPPILQKTRSYNDDDNDDDDKKNDDDDDNDKQRRRKKQQKKRKPRNGDDDKKDKKTKKTKKKQRTVLLSFDVSNDENDDSSSSTSSSDDDRRKKKKKKKKKKSKKSSRSEGGFVGGYGGAHVMEDSDSDKDKDDKPTTATAAAASTYGKEALESLKKEQKRNIVENIVVTADKTGMRDATSVEVDGTKTGTEEMKNDNDGVREIDGGDKESNGVAIDNNNKNEEDSEEEVVIMPLGNNQNEDNEENFISLNYHKEKNNDEINEDTIITGDDATSLADKEPNSTLELMAQNESKNKNNNDDNNDDDSWHDQISQRAGIAPTTTTTHPPSLSSTQPPPPLSHMISILAKTLSTIQTSLSLTQSENKKRDIEIANLAQDSIIPLEKSIAIATKSRDFHRQLRSDLLPLVATLRKLHAKETLVREGVEELYDYYTYGGKGKDYGEEEEWRRDILNFWNGDQKKEDEVVEKDEFGRDVSSLKRRDWQRRVRRRRQRRRRRRENGSDDDDNVAVTARSLVYNSDHDDDDATARLVYDKRIALRQAMRSARQYHKSTTTCDLKDVVSRLHRLIRTWRDDDDDDDDHNPKRKKEFEECFAGESFAELLGCVLMLDVCECLDLMGLLSSENKEEVVVRDGETTTKNEETKNDNDNDNNNTPIFVTNITHLPSFQHLQNDKPSLTLVISKVIHPHFEKILQKGYDPFSTRQTKSLATFYSSLLPYQNDDGGDKVSRWIVNCLKRSVADVAMVYPPDGWTARTMTMANDDEEEDEREMEIQVNVYLAMQVYKYVKLLRHVLGYWYPLLSSSSSSPPSSTVANDCRTWVFVTLVSQRILPSLQFVGDDDENDSNNEVKSSVKAVLMEVRDCLRDNSDWWEIVVEGTDVMSLPRAVLELRNALKRYDL